MIITFEESTRIFSLPTHFLSTSADVALLFKSHVCFSQKEYDRSHVSVNRLNGHRKYLIDNRNGT